MISVDLLARALSTDGFRFAEGTDMRPMLDTHGSLADWDAFAASWNDLALDLHMADGGRYRRRRHAHYSVTAAGVIERKRHAPHFQSLDDNPLNGGVERWFEPITEASGGSQSLMSLLGWCHALFQPLAEEVPAWAVEVHQFRIEARAGERGSPTPEGAHRDGVDFVLVLMIERVNIASGVTSIHAPDGHELGSFTLTAPFDAALVDDHRVWHGVTAVEALDPALPAHRDVLVVTFRAAP